MPDTLTPDARERVEAAVLDLRDAMRLSPCVAVGNCRCPTHKLAAAAPDILTALVSEAVAEERARWECAIKVAANELSTLRDHAMLCVSNPDYAEHLEERCDEALRLIDAARPHPHTEEPC